MYLVIILFVIALSILLFFFIRKKFFHLEIKKSLNYQLFLITIPRDFSLIEQEKQKTFIDFVSVFEQALESLSRYKKKSFLKSQCIIVLKKFVFMQLV